MPSATIVAVFINVPVMGGPDQMTLRSRSSAARRRIPQEIDQNLLAVFSQRGWVRERLLRHGGHFDRVARGHPTTILRMAGIIDLTHHAAFVDRRVVQHPVEGGHPPPPDPMRAGDLPPFID